MAISQQISPSDFVFVVCQQGTESTLKSAFADDLGPFRLAFSRPGLLTFKTSPNSQAGNVQPPTHPLIRQSGWCLGRVAGQHVGQMADQIWKLAGRHWDCIHLFQRDPSLPGQHGFEPGRSPLVDAIADWLQKECPTKHLLSTPTTASPEPIVERIDGGYAVGSIQKSGPCLQINATALPGQKVLDIMVVEPDQWIIGWHVASDLASCWPGGAFDVKAPDEMISRAYLKMAEALAWSQLPISAGDSIVEIGSSPGGAAQRLLDMGLRVTGVDPAEMDPDILAHARFRHWRSKAAGIRRKNYSDFRWLTADANVAPNYTLDVVEDIVNYPTSRFQGLLLTLKMSDYKLIDQLDNYLARIASWKFMRVQARQLAHNRRELTVVAAREGTVGRDKPGHTEISRVGPAGAVNRE